MSDSDATQVDEKAGPPEARPFAAPAAPVMTLEQAKAFGAGRVRDSDLPAVACSGGYL